jgi:hypothetical protein
MSTLPRALGLLALSLLLTASPAEAASSEQVLNYTLLVDGARVGKRTVTIRYLPPDEFSPTETRILESMTEFKATLAGQTFSMKARISARVADGRTAFTANVVENGVAREVQARQNADGSWTIVRSEQGQRYASTLRRSEVDFSTVDLMDPEAWRRVADRNPGTMLVAENGSRLVGRVQDLGQSQLNIGGDRVNAQRYSWTPDVGTMAFQWSEEGLLVGYELSFMGKKMEARLAALPAPRDWGTVTVPNFGEGYGTITEETL